MVNIEEVRREEEGQTGGDWESELGSQRDVALAMARQLSQQLDSQRETLKRRATTAEALRDVFRRKCSECLENRTRVSKLLFSDVLPPLHARDGSTDCVFPHSPRLRPSRMKPSLLANLEYPPAMPPMTFFANVGRDPVPTHSTKPHDLPSCTPLQRTLMDVDTAN
ncbi:unnamed protein product [Ectocarpus sp. 4 AP-2014]